MDLFVLLIFSFLVLSRMEPVEGFMNPVYTKPLRGLMALGIVIVGLIYILSLFRYMAFESKVLSFLGDISFEIYMIHGLFIELFSKYMTGSNLLLIGSSVCVFVLSILSAWVLNRIFSFISRKKHINV